MRLTRPPRGARGPPASGSQRPARLGELSASSCRAVTRAGHAGRSRRGVALLSGVGVCLHSLPTHPHPFCTAAASGPDGVRARAGCAAGGPAPPLPPPPPAAPARGPPRSRSADRGPADGPGWSGWAGSNDPTRGGGWGGGGDGGPTAGTPLRNQSESSLPTRDVLRARKRAKRLVTTWGHCASLFLDKSPDNGPIGI